MALCAAAIGLFWWQVSALPAGADGVDFANDDRVLIGSAPVALDVRNDGPTDLTIEVRAGPLMDGQGHPSGRLLMTAADDAVVAPVQTLAIDATSATTVELSVADWDGTTSLTGSVELVTASDDGPIVAARRAVDVNPGADLVLAVDEWEVTSYRGALRMGERAYHTRLPLAEGHKCPVNVHTSTVLSSGDDTGELKMSCARGNAYAGIALTGLEIGSYSGQIDTGSGALAVTVRRSTVWVLPAFCAALGLVAAGLRSFWLERRRRVVRAQERLDSVLRLGEQAQREFATAAGGNPWSTYDVRPAILAWLRDWRKRLQEAGDKDLTDEVRQDAGRVAGVIAQWERASAAFADLKQGLSQAPSEVEENLPALAPALCDASAGQAQAADIDEITRLLGNASSWEQVERLAGRLAKLNDMANQPRSDLQGANREVFDRTAQEIRAAQGQAQNIDDSSGLGELAAKLDAIEVELSKLPPLPSLLEVRAAGGITGAEEPPARRDDKYAQEMIRAYSRRLQRITADALVLGVAAIVGVYTALSELYIGQAWGTWLDLVAIVVWAFGATAVLSDVLQALLRLVERDKPTTGV